MAIFLTASLVCLQMFLISHAFCVLQVPNTTSSYISPANVPYHTHNYCKEIITALESNNTNIVKKEFLHFFNSIPYTVRIRDRNFFSSVFLALLQCISSKDSKDRIAKFKRHKEYDSIKTSYTVGSNIYVFQIRVFDYENDIKNHTLITKKYYKNKQSKKEIKKNIIIAFDYASNQKINPLKVCLISNDGYKKSHIKASKTSYHEDNLYKRLLYNLSPETIHNAAKHLSTIYNNIPLALHINSEKFYHSLFFCLIKFIGNGDHRSEIATHHGRADLILHLAHVDCIIEFKFKKTASRALDQIEDRKYFEFLASNSKPIYIIGVNIEKIDNLIDVVMLCEEHNNANPSPMKKILRKDQN